MRVLGLHRWGVLGVVLVAAGCTDRPAGTSEEGSSTTEAATTEAATSAGSASGTSGASTGSTSGAVGSTSGSSSDGGVLDEGPWCSVPGEDAVAHCPPDSGSGGAFECDLLAQDCPVGEKCSPWANDGGPAWNATRCAPIERVPAPVGAPCTVEGSAVSGLDSCDIGAQCWNVDPDTLEGVCVAMCTGDSSDPLCEDPDTTCAVANDGAIALCLPLCDPLLQDCPDGQICVPEPNSDAGFVCMPPVGVGAADGDPCEYLNVCAAGSVCATAEAVPGCDDALGCCTPFCDLDVPGSCPLPGTECVPWDQTGAQPPAFFDEGLCAAVPETPASGWSPFPVVRANLP